MHRAGRVFSVTAFPAVMVAALAFAWQLLQADFDPSIAIIGPMIASFTFVLVFERFFPHEQEWLRGRGDVPVDASFAVTDVAVQRLVEIALLPAVVVVGDHLAWRYGSELWPTALSVPVQVGFALIFAEFFKYWGHRFSHEWQWLWRFHATHHSVRRLYWLNASRFHPVDIAIDTFLGVGSLVLLGCPKPILALFALVSAVHGVFQHCNLRLRLGPLNWFFSMAELHRWHHSPSIEEANHNYGNNLIVWDVVFGTRFLPRDRNPPVDIGLADMPDFPTGYFGQLSSPFRWRSLRMRGSTVTADSR